MRSLVVAYEYPWPVNSGSRHRLSMTLRALSACGPTRLLSITPDSRSDFDEPDASTRLEDVRRVTVSTRQTPWGLLAHPLLPSTFPLGGPRAWSDISRAISESTADLVWFFDLRSWVLSGEIPTLPAVLDLDDLEHRKIQGRLALGAATGDPWRRLPGRTFSRLDAARWVRLARSASKRMARTVVCSELDARRGRRTAVLSES